MPAEVIPQACLLFIDWLGISIRMNGEPSSIPGYLWRCYSATNVWARRDVLYSEDGDRVLTLLFQPRSSVIAASSALVEISNEWLYHGGGVERILDVLLRSVFFEVTGFSRLDLAVDFCPTEHQREVIWGLAAGQYYIAGKRNGSGFWSVDNNKRLHQDWRGRTIPHCQSWGHKTSGIRWKLYYKTKELLDAGGGKFMDKPYIIDHWRQHGMDISNVWRLEVSIKHTNDLTFCGDHVTLETLQESREDLFLSMYHSRFIVKANEGHVDRTNDTTIDFLPVKNMRSVVRYSEPKRMAEHSGRITLLRHLVASLEDEQVLLDKPTREGVYSHIYQLLQRDNLHNYFRAMTGYWFEEFTNVTTERAVTAIRTNSKYAIALQHDGKGLIGAERQIDTQSWRKCVDIAPKTDFECYDVDNCPIPTREGDVIRMRRRGRSEVQYDKPVVIPFPTENVQLCIKHLIINNLRPD